MSELSFEELLKQSEENGNKIRVGSVVEGKVIAVKPEEIIVDIQYKADGIITRSDVNLSKPITRLQMAQLAAGALKLDTSNLSSVQPFTDTTDASVRALNAAGIVEGYFSGGTSTFKPDNTLTRGQVSAIVWRMQNYRK